MRWFRSHPKITIISAIVLILLILLYISIASVGKDNILGRTLGNAVIQLQKPLSFLGNSASDKANDVFNGEGLTKENDRLKEEIIRLENELTKEKLNNKELKDLKKLSKYLKGNGLTKGYDPVASNVIAFDGSTISNVFTIDSGTNVGVKVNSPVVNEDGLIGRVVSVGSNWAKVITIMDESNKIGFNLSTNNSFRGVCNGVGDGMLSGYFFDEKARVAEGDTIVTSGIGGVYPGGIKIGEVTSVDWTDKSMFKTIEIEPSVYFKGIRKVAVLT